MIDAHAPTKRSPKVDSASPAVRELNGASVIALLDAAAEAALGVLDGIDESRVLALAGADLHEFRSVGERTSEHIQVLNSALQRVRNAAEGGG